MIDTLNGQLRVRAWPKKRGTPTSAKQLSAIEWFKQANLLTKFVDAASMIRAIEITAGSRMYPRDILLSAMKGRLYNWVDQYGNKWNSMAAIQDISDSLDVLAQAVGSVLVRATDRWRAPPPGVFGDVLTNQGINDPAIWLAPAGGGGITQQVISGTPIVPDGTQILYDVDVSAYTSVQLILEGIGFNIADRPNIRFSTDGGTSFKAGASDYRSFFSSHGQSGARLFAEIQTTYRDQATAQNGTLGFTNLRAGRAAWTNASGTTTALAFAGGGFATFAGPITDIRILSGAGRFFNAGTIRLVGSK